ncbi:spindle assembly checkpoint component Mad1 [Globomyces pollinis-pini]|nr:spindle assembly checkpoint component Mad1 [Globomyces pollinis-pini]
MNVNTTKRKYSETDSESRKIIQLERDYATLKLELDTMRKQMTKLSIDRQMLLKRDLDSKSTIGSLNSKLAILQNKLDTTLSSHQCQLSALKDDLFHKDIQVDDLKSKLSLASETIETINSKLKSVTDRNNFLTQRLNESSSIQHNTTSVADSAQPSTMDTLTLEELQLLRKRLPVLELKVEKLTSEKLKLLDQNTFLNAMMENIQKLREEKNSVQFKLDKAMEMRRDLSVAQLKLEELQKEKEKWTSFINQNGSELGIDSPLSMAKILSDQKNEICILKEKIIDVDIVKRQLSQATESFKLERCEILKRNNELLMKIKSQKSKLLNYDSIKQILEKQIGYLREALKSYEIEASQLPDYNGETLQRIHNLEKLLDESVTNNTSLRNEIDRLGALVNQRTLSNDHSDIEYIDELKRKLKALDTENENLKEKLLVSHSDMEVFRQKVEEMADIQKSTKKIANLERTNEQLNEQLKKLENHIGVLEQQVGTGDYNPLTTKILMLKDNPLSEILNNRQKKLESFSQMSVKNDSALVNEKSLSFENHELKKDVQTYEKKILRLKDIYSKKVSEFRQNVYSLLGYKFDVQMDSETVKLSSIYAKPTDPTFLFKPSQSLGELQIVGGSDEINECIEKMIGFYVKEYNSIPGLLASVTLFFFNQRYNI